MTYIQGSGVPTPRQVKRYIEDIADALALLPRTPTRIAHFLEDEGLMECTQADASNCPLTTWIIVNNMHWPAEVDVAVTGRDIELTWEHDQVALIDTTRAESEFVRLFDLDVIGRNLCLLAPLEGPPG